MKNHFFASLASSDSESQALRHANNCYEIMHQLYYSSAYDGLDIAHADKARAEWSAAKELLSAEDAAKHYSKLETLLNRARAPYEARQKARAISAAKASKSKR